MMNHRLTAAVVYLALVLATAFAQDPPQILFNGRVIDDLGSPMEGAQVQFWHTDGNGNYNHPGFDSGGVALLPDFQYFGTATTAADGSFQFRTIRPGIYAARPITHIHYKVWWNGNDVLTSQFYFIDEGTSQPPLLQLALIEQVDGSLLTNKTIAVDMGLGGSEQITPAQTAGPFYPVVDFFDFDSDLTVVTTQEQGTPIPAPSPQEGNVAATTTAPVVAPQVASEAPSDTLDISTSTERPTLEMDSANTLNSDSTASVIVPEIRAMLSGLLVLAGLLAV